MRPRKPWPRRIAAFLAAFALLAGLLVGVVALGVLSLDAQPLRGPVEVALTRALGRDVRIAGPARLALSFHPALVVHDVRIANPPDFVEPEFASPEFATIAELRLDTELLPLLRGRLIVHELRGRGIRLRLARSEGGRGNWLFEPAARSPDEPPPRFRADWRRLVAEQGVVEFTVAGAQRSLQVQQLVLEGLGGPPLQLAVEGTAGAQIPFRGEAGSPRLPSPTGEEPWPFTARVDTPQSAASVHGRRESTDAGPVLRLRVDARTANLDEIGALLGVTLPVAGMAALAGELELAPGRFALRQLEARLGGVEVVGELAVDTRGPRPRVSGRLDLPVADLAAVGGSEPTQTLAALYAAFSDAELHLERLSQFDAELELGLGRLAGAPGDPGEIDATIRVDAGRLRAPFTATIAGAAVAGELSADAVSAAPAFGLRLAARDAAMGGLADLLFDLPHVAGSVRDFSIDLSASGRALAELMRDLEARVRIEDARLSYGNYPGGRPIGLHIASAEFAQPRGGSLAASLRGSLREKPFAGSAEMDSIERVLRQRQTPFRFEGSSGGARLRLAGVLAEPGMDSGPDIEIDLSAPQARELAPWLGFSSHSAAAVSLRGRVRARARGASLEAGSLQFGRSSIEGQVEWRRGEGKAQVSASLVAALLEPAELRDLRSAPAPGSMPTWVDIPILPERLDFSDADLALTVGRVSGLALDVGDLVFQGRLRDGAIAPSPIALRLQGNRLDGNLAVDLRGTAPAARLSLAGDAFDAGPLLRQLRLAQDIDAPLGRLTLQVDLEGSRLGEALEHSSFLARFGQGVLSYRDPGSRSRLDLALLSGELRATAGGPITGSLAGTAGGVAVTVELEGGPLQGLLAPAARWPFMVTAVLPEARWTLGGSATPGRQPATELQLSLSGKRLDDLDVLLATALPPWGPYELTGRLRFMPGVYQVEEARLAIGDSQLLGSAFLDTGGRPPRLQVQMAAPVIQLDDFPLGGWSPLPASGGRMTARTARAALASGMETVHPLLSRQRLATGNLQADIRVERLLAGADELGRGRVAAQVVDGALTLGPIEIDGRAGRASLSVAYEPREQDALFSARATVNRLDYGLVAALFDPASEINGTASLNLAIDAVTPELGQLMNTASGHVDLAVWPEALRWGVFDLWAANLLRSLLPFFTPATSHLNCVIGNFDLDQGRLRSQALIIDTTNTRTSGWAEADFATERLHMRFVPGHKRPRLFSVAVPVEVRGTFSDYRIALRPADALGRVGQWFKALVMMPLHWFGVGRVPRDGHDVCAEPTPR